ncbi:MAG: hypothetical protein Q9M35_10475 [Rhodothermus sp.]|nr:hypothetical protein [Rhodothermus sp.]
MKGKNLLRGSWIGWLLGGVLLGCDAAQEPVLVPEIVAGNQMLVNQQVKIKRVTTPAAGWVVVRRIDRAPQLAGVAAVAQGRRTNLPVPYTLPLDDDEVAWCSAMLYRDLGRIGQFEPEVDRPFQVNQQPVEARFFLFQGGAVTDGWIVVEDQEVVNQTVIIEEVGVGEPADLVIHRDAGNRPKVPGVIARKPLEPGIYRQLEVKLFPEETVSCGERLWPMLHVRSVSDDQPYDIDKPIITTSFTVLCTD